MSKSTMSVSVEEVIKYSQAYLAKRDLLVNEQIDKLVTKEMVARASNNRLKKILRLLGDFNRPFSSKEECLNYLKKKESTIRFPSMGPLSGIRMQGIRWESEAKRLLRVSNLTKEPMLIDVEVVDKVLLVGKKYIEESHAN